MPLHHCSFDSSRLATAFNLLKNRISLVFCGLLLLGTSVSASVQYTFTSTSAFNGMAIGSFQLTVPTYISTTSDFAVGDLDACTISAGTCGTMNFFPDPAVFGHSGDEDVVGFAAAGSPNALYYFEDHAFLAVGSYATVFWDGSQVGTLIVTESATPGGTVPEPGTMPLLSLGLAGIALIRKTRQC